MGMKNNSRNKDNIWAKSGGCFVDWVYGVNSGRCVVGHGCWSTKTIYKKNMSLVEDTIRFWRGPPCHVVLTMKGAWNLTIQESHDELSIIHFNGTKGSQPLDAQYELTSSHWQYVVVDSYDKPVNMDC